MSKLKLKIIIAKFYIWNYNKNIIKSTTNMTKRESSQKISEIDDESKRKLRNIDS
jgi:hypothetical protein